MKRRSCLVYFLLLAPFLLVAQTRTITGRVVSDSSNQPLSGVSVSVKGKPGGTTTNADGKYSINVSENNAILTFSYVGYTSSSVSTAGKSVVNVTLANAASNLNDVVVIGYTTVKRKDVLASVASIGAKDLKDIPINNVAEALNGRLAGLTATTSEGSPDANIKVRIRGGMSITGSNDPLYIIDGVQVEGGLSAVAPQDIQSIDVLKDAAATAIYGARGANGVIIITTKSGRRGKPVVSYNGFVGMRNLTRELEVMSPYEYVVNLAENARRSSVDSAAFAQSYGTTWDTLSVYKNIKKVDWQREVFGQTGFTQTHNLNVAGGSKKITYNVGFTRNDDKAIVLNSSYQRNLLNLKTDYAVTDKLKFGVTSRASIQDVYGAGVSAENGSSSLSRLRNSIRYRPWVSNAQDIEDYTDPLNPSAVGNGLNLVNPIKLANAEYRKKTTTAANVTVYGQYTIAKGLTFKSTFGWNYTQRNDRQYFDTLSSMSKAYETKPFISLDTVTNKTITNSNVFSYAPELKKGHKLDLLAGQETYDYSTEIHSNRVKGFPFGIGANGAFNHQDSGVVLTGYPQTIKTRFTQLSFFGRVGYSYKDKYLMSANVRYDGASKFAANQRWGVFPAGSLAWRVKKETFLKKVDAISDLKFRFGIGNMGNNRINDYLYLNTFNTTYPGSTTPVYYSFNGNPVFGYYPQSLPNPALKWESTVNRNFGMDLSLFHSRLDVSVDYYINSSKDLLLDVNIDPSYGFSTQTQNVGKTKNTGIEVQVNAALIRNPKGFNWNASFNLSHNVNKVVALGPGQKESLVGPAYQVTANDYILRVGQPVGMMYGMVADGFYTVNDFNYNAATSAYTLKPGVVDNSPIIGAPLQPGSIKFKDLNGDGKVDLNNDRTVIGNPNPKLTGGLSQTFTYKGWDMSIFANFMYGFDVYNANRIEFTNAYSPNSNQLAIMVDRWRTVDPSNGKLLQWVSNGVTYGVAPDVLSSVNANAKMWIPLSGNGAFNTTSFAIEDGSFLRLNNVTIGYTFPVKKRISKLRVYATGNNLAILTKYSGYDPEVSLKTDPRMPNFDYSAYPKSRAFIFGINASF